MENKNLEQVQEEVKEVETVEEVQQGEVIEQVQTELEESITQFEQEKKGLLKEIDELKQHIEELNKEVEKKNLSNLLKENGLGEFTGLFELETNEERVEFLKKAVNNILVKNSYQPKEVAKQEAYTQAIEQGDVQKALGFKFANLFKKGN